MIAAHLDTVFPPETNVKVSRDGAVLRGPGIGDNCRGLAVLVAIARALNGGRVRTPGSITFVANVGEEGLGDLRGVKALFAKPTRPDRPVRVDRWGRREYLERGRGQPSIPCHLQGPGRTQLRRLRAGQPGGRVGPRRGEAVRRAGAHATQDDLHDRTHRGRHVRQFDSVRSLDGSRHAVVEPGGAGRARHEVSHRRRRGSGGGEPALVATRDDYGRQGARRRSARRRDSVSVADCPDGAGGGTHAWACTRAQRRLHRREPSYQLRKFRRSPSAAAARRPTATRSPNRSIRPTRGRAHRTPSCSRSRCAQD